jgi:hypothetical protein
MNEDILDNLSPKGNGHLFARSIHKNMARTTAFAKNHEITGAAIGKNTQI